jgi:DNA-binding NarL/FixJ family response regulator
MLAHGLTARQIAARLKRSQGTIETTSLRARNKLGLPRIAAVVRYVVTIGEVWPGE